MSTSSFSIHGASRYPVAVCLLSTLLVLLLSWLLRVGTDDEFYGPKSRILARTATPGTNIVLVTIEETTLAESPEPWPWERYPFATVASYCSEARVVLFDVLFDGDRLPPMDRILANRVATNRARGCQTVSALYLNRESDPESLSGMHRFALSGASLAAVPDAWSHRSCIAPYRGLLDRSEYLGHCNFPLRSLGEYSMVARWQNRVYPSLALAACLAARDVPPNAFDLAAGGMPGLETTTDPEGNVHLRYYQEDYPFITFGDVRSAFSRDDNHPGLRFFPLAARGIEAGMKSALAGQSEIDTRRIHVFDKSFFENRIVLVGSTATGLLRDHEATPINQSTPGLRIHATAVDNLLRGHRVWDWSHRWDMLPIFLLGILPALARGESPVRLFVFAALTLCCYLAIALGLLVTRSWFLPWLWPTLALVLSSVVLASISWGRERVQRRELESMEASKQMFTDMLVHDLKGRISTMVMSMSMVKEEMPADSRPQKLFATMNASGNRLLTQVNALLDIRKIEEGRMQLDLQPTNLSDVLKEAVHEYGPSAALMKQQIALHLDEDLRQPVHIDRAIFQRIISNLVWNAMHYATPGTEIELGCRVVDGGHYSMFVANRGKVVAPDVIEKLFKPFVTGGNDRNTKTVGIGLGLAFCRLATEAHGGTISFLSPWNKAGDGVEVVLELPFSP